MELLKVKNGLLEVENYFLTSPFADFAGSANVSRNPSTGTLQLVSDATKIERNFKYDDFLLELEKENFNDMSNGDYSMIYFGSDELMFGIRDKVATEQHKYWKILRENDYIQAYCSTDGIEYTNIGGMKFGDPLTKQGFQKMNSDPFILNKYRLYAAPYLTVQNFPEGTVCELYDSTGALLKTRAFDASMECKIFLDYNDVDGYLVFKDDVGAEIFKTGSCTFGYGDVWVISPYNFRIEYLGNVVTNVNPALLQDLDEVISIRNVGHEDYKDIHIGTQTAGNDLIELSLDGLAYYNELVLDFAVDEIKQVYVRITRNAANNNFKVRDFQLVIT